MPPAPSYASLLGRNAKVARVAAGLSQADVAERMRQLGFTSWLSQTVSSVERARRRVTAEELFWLSYVARTSITRLMSPDEGDHWIAAPSGGVIHAQHARQRMRSVGDDAVRWDGNKPVFMTGQAGWEPADDGGEPDYFMAQQQSQDDHAV